MKNSLFFNDHQTYETYVFLSEFLAYLNAVDLINQNKQFFSIFKIGIFKNLKLVYT